MSVYKSARAPASAEFLQITKELRKETMRIVRKFLKSYRWEITNGLLELVREIVVNCEKANDIFICKTLSENDYLTRHNLLLEAKCATRALRSEITFLYELVNDGNNYFKNRADYDRVFQAWIQLADDAYAKIRGLISSDKQRYEKILKERMSMTA